MTPLAVMRIITPICMHAVKSGGVKFTSTGHHTICKWACVNIASRAFHSPWVDVFISSTTYLRTKLTSFTSPHTSHTLPPPPTHSHTHPHSLSSGVEHCIHWVKLWEALDWILLIEQSRSDQYVVREGWRLWSLYIDGHGLH